ncbi:MAG: sugar-binding protein, partial [Pseudomonadota bacterium]
MDGDLGDWSKANFTTLGARNYHQETAPRTGDADLLARFALAYDEQALYVAAEVTDDVTGPAQPPETLWLTDSLQLALDADNDRTRGAYDQDGDYEYGCEFNGEANRFVAPPNAPASQADVKIGQQGRKTIYEARIPWAELAPAQPNAGARYGFNLMVNDNDGAARKGWLELTPGMGSSKDPSLFATLVLGPAAALDGGVTDATVTDATAPDASPTDAVTAPDSAVDATAPVEDAAGADAISPGADAA